MKLSIQERNGVVILEPKGKILGGPDATTLKDQLQALIDSGKTRVVIDLAEVDYMNSTGLGILISTLTTLRRAQGELKLANVTEKIQSLLTITKLVTVFDDFESVDEAVAAFSR
jgi:anti-sigma B factor antagonist